MISANDAATIMLQDLFTKVAPDMSQPDRQFVAAFPNWETQYTWETVPNSCDTPNNLMNFEMFWGIVRSEEGENLYNLFEYEISSYLDYCHEEMYKNLKRAPFESFEAGLIDFSGPFAKIDVDCLVKLAVKVYEEYLATK